MVDPNLHPSGLIERYRERLPIRPETVPATMGEGGTPLIAARWLSEELGCRVFLKYEAVNPTGSFKDRGMTVAITKALEDGANSVICASTGNTSASAAAYAARAGMRCVVLIPEGKIAMGKLSQALMHGADVIAIDGNFDEALDFVKDISSRLPITMVNSLNPYRIEGQKTGAFEIVEVLGEAPAMLSIPVGNAGNITSYWKGFREYERDGLAQRLPVMWGFQAAGANPLVVRTRHREAGDRGDGYPHRESGAGGRGSCRGARLGRRYPGRHRRGDPGGAASACPEGGRVLRAGLRGQRGGSLEVRINRPAEGGHACGGPDRSWSQGPADGHRSVAAHRALPGGSGGRGRVDRHRGVVRVGLRTPPPAGCGMSVVEKESTWRARPVRA